MRGHLNLSNGRATAQVIFEKPDGFIVLKPMELMTLNLTSPFNSFHTRSDTKTFLESNALHVQNGVTDRPGGGVSRVDARTRRQQSLNRRPFPVAVLVPV